MQTQHTYMHTYTYLGDDVCERIGDLDCVVLVEEDESEEESIGDTTLGSEVADGSIMCICMYVYMVCYLLLSSKTQRCSHFCTRTGACIAYINYLIL